MNLRSRIELEHGIKISIVFVADWRGCFSFLVEPFGYPIIILAKHSCDVLVQIQRNRRYSQGHEFINSVNLV